MNLKDAISRHWRDLSITAKFGYAFTLLLCVLVIEAVVSLAALSTVRSAEAEMLSSMEIRQRIFEMDGELEKARRLHLAFFLQYQEVGFAKAHSQYFAPAQAVISRVVDLSEQLKVLAADGDTSQAMRQRSTDITLYLASAKRFSETFEELIGLVTALAMPNHGLQSTLTAHREHIGHLAEKDPALLLLFQKMVLGEQAYLITHQRPHMQAAMNIGFQLGKAAGKTAVLDAQEKDALRQALKNYDKTAQRILEVQVAIRGKFNDFALQAKAVDPISADLKALASTEVERARARITAASALSTVIIVVMAATGLIFALAVASLINASITRRITALTGSAGELRAGNLDVHADATAGDELGQLASTFNDMAGRMRDLVGNLEGNVRDRTAELGTARDKLEEAVRELGEKNMALEVLSRTDRLTGISNRRKLEEALQTEILRARRYGKPFSVIMLDVDHFKDINDAFGHHAGDTVLSSIAGKLATRARETDVVGRWGGEEFLIVCPESSLKVATALAERLREEFSEGTFPEAGRVTSSFGVASFRTGDDMDSLILRADVALYQAKDKGRNRVQTEEPA